MKPLIDSITRLRAVHGLPLVVFAGVLGHFNVSSTDDGYEGKGLTDIATSSVPGAPVLKLDID